MKTVHTPENVAHLFANQLQTEARNSGNTLFFNRQTIYSYGYHFPIAKHTTNKRGENALLFTTRSYSNTTAKHISVVRSATNHLKTIYCYNPENNPTDNLQQFEREIKNILGNLVRAKKPEKYILEAEAIQQRAQKYADYFGLKIKNIDKLIESAKVGKYTEALKKEAERKKRSEALKLKKQQKEFLEQLSKWRNFETGKLYGRLFEVDYLRYNEQNNRIETSQGIEIPVEIAKRSFNWVNSTNECNGCNYSILDYKVTELNNEFIKIGCHKITRFEINTIAKKLNWI